MFGDTALRHPVEQRIENRRSGLTRQQRPFLCWILSAVMTGVLIYELIYNQNQQHSPISLKVCVPRGFRRLTRLFYVRIDSPFLV